MKMNRQRPILLMEDSVRDAELILAALEPHQLANEVLHVRDGAEAHSKWCQDFVEAVKQVSGCWAVVNEVPAALSRSETAAF
jgi:CheY-like chemotaxis protein